MVNSSSGSEIMVELSRQEISGDRNDQRDFDLQFEVEELRISPYSMAASPLHITAFPYTGVGTHTIVVSAKSPPEADLVITKNETEHKSNSTMDDISENFMKFTPEAPPYATDEIKVEESRFLIK